MTPMRWRLIAVLFVAVLFSLKFLVLGSVAQISLEDITAHTAMMLGGSIQGEAVQTRQPLRKDLQQFQFHLADCESPYVALQSLIMEDPQAVLDAAQPLPPNLEPHVIYLGDELALSDRIGIKLTAVRQFIAYRLGLSPERPAVHMYIVMAAPNCTGYRKLDWTRVWAA